MNAPLPTDEATRIAALQQYDLLDTPSEEVFDELTRLAAYICGTPIALVSLVDTNRQWFKSKVGLDALETPRDIAFCAHTILQPDVFIVPDALADQRFAESPLVTDGPHVRFYAGVPLISSDGHAVGALCVNDTIPRDLHPDQVEALRTLGRQVMAQMELRRHISSLEQSLAEKERVAEALRQTREQEEIISRQAEMLAELSTPLIPIDDQILIMPLIGAIDSRRAQQVVETLLNGIAESRAQVAIIDITGVSVVDTQVASALIRAAQAVKLLGAQVILTGIRPEIAQTLVGLGIDLKDIVTRVSLQNGIAYAMSQR
jgi:anti-anti-sigma regulatory factor